jgi:LysM domain
MKIAKHGVNRPIPRKVYAGLLLFFLIALLGVAFAFHPSGKHTPLRAVAATPPSSYTVNPVVAPRVPVEAPVRAHATAPLYYTVRPGDSLWVIAVRYCGTGTDWVSLWHADFTVIGGHPDLIFPGQRLALNCSWRR